ncbi:MAG: low-specificity L-threonine aldolase [Polyangiaceae bacterium]|nr:low-specificity L-threonine aldolase [Polyangiaceae bacterium]
MTALADLRSDTVTKPTPGMREAMARAEVGDDVYGEDPTVEHLQARVAEVTGKEAALFVPSGTMGNQIALLCHTRRGDEVVIGEGAHCAFYESGAAPAWSGVQFAVAGAGGLFSASEFAEVIKPIEYHLPRSSLVVIENTHNRAGGRVFPQEEIAAIAEVAREKGLGLHLDGARIWNAAAATGLSVASLAAPFDTVSVCFSKGLGAPVGSALAGPLEMIRAARRFRKMLGGGMRQAGILAAGALYALDHHRERIGEDHQAARAIAAEVAKVSGAMVADVETNIINIDTPSTPAARVVEAARLRGVLVGASGPRRVRAVTHLDVRPEVVEDVARALAEAVREAIDEAARA